MAAKDSKIFINRELSWLDFNYRVMELSHEKSVPLGEQLNFAAIYESNLNEFFMIRVGSLCDQTLLKKELKENKTNLTAQQQLDAIMPKVDALQGVLDKNVTKLYERLAALGIAKADFDNMDKRHLNDWKKYFLRELFPVLSPQIVDRRHPFPFLRNLEIYVGAVLKEKKSEVSLLGLIPVSSQFQRLITVVHDDGTETYALVEELILQFAEATFGKGNVQEKCLFRVTRNADISLQEGMFDHDIDYRVVMSELLKKRRKLAAVRLQMMGENVDSIRQLLLEKLFLPANQCSFQKTPLDLSFLRKLAGKLEQLGDPSLFYPPQKAIASPGGNNLTEAVKKHDSLTAYPFESMRPFIDMLFDAASDPEVISIKMTLYRMASDSDIIKALIKAAENGKEVVTIVELRARFDEENNINWSRQLENAGCTVIYGFTDYKVHSKLLLITRRQGSNYEYISQIGTGNFNEKTSELYTDIAYTTMNTEIGEELGAVFNNLAMERLTDEVNHLIVAPLKFKSVLLEEIEEEIRYQNQGGKGCIIIKCNSVSDKNVIEMLSKASMAGVSVDMIVRGICCLRAGQPELTDNIAVRSLVGRYLEHSRIFAFGSGDRMRVYIASGDFLTRNTERRVEVGIRIMDADTRQTLRDILELQLMDNVNASLMQPDGSYVKIKPKKDEKLVDSQLDMFPYIRERLVRLARRDRVQGGTPKAAVSAPAATPAAGAAPTAGKAKPSRSLWKRFRNVLKRG